MLRTLSLCLTLVLGGAALADECDYKQPAPSPDMIKAHEMRKGDGPPFGLVLLLKDITAKEPNNALAWQWRGMAENAAGETKAAYESLTRALEIYPCDPLARVTRADFAERLGRQRDAYDDYSYVLARDPKHAYVLRLRGDLLFGAAQFSAALADYEAALATGSEDVDLLLNHGGLMQELGRYRDAIADYERILKTDSRNEEALVARGYSRFILGEYAAAEPDLAVGARINPNAAAWTFLARTHMGRQDANEQFIYDAQAARSGDWAVYTAGMMKAGAPEHDLLRFAGVDAEKRCNIYFYLGEVALAKGDRARAKELFLKGADACPKNPAHTNGSLREYVAMTEELKRMK